MEVKVKKKRGKKGRKMGFHSIKKECPACCSIKMMLLGKTRNPKQMTRYNTNDTTCNKIKGRKKERRKNALLVAQSR